MATVPKPPCATGRHRAGVRWHDDEADLDRSRCLDCRHPILRSRATRRWIVSAYLA